MNVPEGLSYDAGYIIELEDSFSTLNRSTSYAAICSDSRRKNVMKEMLDTEKTYLEFVQTVLVLFVTPLRRSVEHEHPPLITEDEFNAIFQNIEEIQKLHTDLLKTMAKRTIDDGAEWADILVTKCSNPQFRSAYQKYVNGYNKASALVSSAMKSYEAVRDTNSIVPGSKEAFGQFLKEKLSHKLCIGFGSLSSFLITPVQRLPRYLLFLKDLEKCTDKQHPDYNNILEAKSVLSKLTAYIDEQKDLYDKMFRVEGLFQRFSSQDRAQILTMTDPVRDLIAEAPMLEGKTKQLRYMLLFTDLLICATKVENSLHLEWKVDLYNSKIDTITKNGIEYFKTFSQKKIMEYPFTLEEVHEIYSIEESKYNSKFWKEKFAQAQSNRRNFLHLFQYTSTVCADMKNHLLSERDITTLFSGNACTYSKAETIRDQRQIYNELILITNGFVLIEKKVGGELIKLRSLGPGDFIGEMAYLSKSARSKPSSAIVTADSDKVLVLKVTYDNLDEVLKIDPYLARRFFQLLCVILSYRMYGESLAHAEENREIVIQQSTPLPERASSSDDLVTSISLLQHLKLPPSEVVVQRFSCQLKSRHLGGMLYILKEHVCFTSKIFGFSTRHCFASGDLENCETVEDNVLRLYYVKKKKSKQSKSIDFEMKNNQELRYAARSIIGMINRKMVTDTNISNLSRIHTDDIYPLTYEHWKVFRTIATDMKFSNGEVVITQGLLSTKLYQVKSGSCKVEVSVPNGSSKQVGTISTGEIFGEMSFIMGTVSGASVIANGDCFIIAIDRPQLEELLNKDPTLAAAFYRFTARLLRKRLLRYQSRNLHSEKVRSSSNVNLIASREVANNNNSNN